MKHYRRLPFPERVSVYYIEDRPTLGHILGVALSTLLAAAIVGLVIWAIARGVI